MEYEEWEAALRALVTSRYGIDLDDLPDFDFESGFEDGYSPEEYFDEEMLPEL